MSVYSPRVSSSSSSSSSCSSSVSTGCFSEESFSSLSTIIAPQPAVRPFGDPDYNYFWIENKSKTNPKDSYYYNYKSHCVVWNRPLPKTVPLPIYSSTWVPEPKNLSEDEEDLIVSDPEDAFQKQKRLQIKQRNRRLAVEDTVGIADVISVNKTLKSRKKLHVFWKLYRLPGETIEDVKNRLLEPSENEVEIKNEILSNKDENSNSQDLSIISIKEEPEFNNDTYDEYSLTVQEVSQSLEKLEGEEDSDPDNVDFVIKQEYNVTNGYDSEMENDSYDESDSGNDVQQKEQSSDSEEEDSEWDSNDDSEEELGIEKQLVENVFYPNSQNYTCLETNIENCNLEEPEMDDDFEEQLLLSDMLEIQIDENDKENIFAEFSNTVDSNETEKVKWSFERSSESASNSMLTRSVLNPVYKTSKPKPTAEKKKNKRLVKKMPVDNRRVPKIIIKREPYYHIKQEPDTASDTQPLVYDMYGTRTTNYDHYPTKSTKERRWQSCTLSSESSGDESVVEETIAQRIKNEPRRSSNEVEKKLNGAEQGALELKNWFPTSKRDSRKRKNSDNSWVGSDLSSNSDIDQADVMVIRKKKREKRTCSIDEQEEFQAETTTTTSNKPLTSAMDLSTVKVELHSPKEDLIGFTQELEVASMKTQEEEEEEEKKKDVVQNEKPEEENDATADSESDSSSSSCCSRTSCSCSSSSSSSSSSDDENDKQAKKKDL